MSDTPIEVQFTSAGCLNYPCRTPAGIVHVGHNIASTDTVLWMRVMDRRRGPHPPNLIVIDPRRTATAKEADIHLAPRVGTNVALLNGILHVLIGRNWIDREFIDGPTIGFPDGVAGLSYPKISYRSRGTLVRPFLGGVRRSSTATSSPAVTNPVGCAELAWRTGDIP
jgi:anaerobic selenocysteine-containing dehydrogenase